MVKTIDDRIKELQKKKEVQTTRADAQKKIREGKETLKKLRERNRK